MLYVIVEDNGAVQAVITQNRFIEKKLMTRSCVIKIGYVTVAMFTADWFPEREELVRFIGHEPASVNTNTANEILAA